MTEALVDKLTASGGVEQAGMTVSNKVARSSSKTFRMAERLGRTTVAQHQRGGRTDD